MDVMGREGLPDVEAIAFRLAAADLDSGDAVLDDDEDTCIWEVDDVGRRLPAHLYSLRGPITLAYYDAQYAIRMGFAQEAQMLCNLARERFGVAVLLSDSCYVLADRLDRVWSVPISLASTEDLPLYLDHEMVRWSRAGRRVRQILKLLREELAVPVSLSSHNGHRLEKSMHEPEPKPEPVSPLLSLVGQEPELPTVVLPSTDRSRVVLL